MKYEVTKSDNGLWKLGVAFLKLQVHPMAGWSLASFFHNKITCSPTFSKSFSIIQAALTYNNDF